MQMIYREYAISQLRIVRSGLHLVTYLDVGNFCDKRIEKTLHEIFVQGFLRFSDSNKPRQSVSLIYEVTWLAGIGKSWENLLKTACKVAPAIKVAHIFWWRQDNRNDVTTIENNRQVRVNIDATLVAIFRIWPRRLPWYSAMAGFISSLHDVSSGTIDIITMNFKATALF